MDLQIGSDVKAVAAPWALFIVCEGHGRCQTAASPSKLQVLTLESNPRKTTERHKRAIARLASELPPTLGICAIIP